MPAGPDAPDGPDPPAGTHRHPVRVYYEDTDFSGVVYHAGYLRFLERGRTEYLRAAGIDQSALQAGGLPLVFAVRRLSVEFIRPARMDDLLAVDTRAAELRGASLVMAQRILRDGTELVTAQVHVAALADGRPVRLPEALRTAVGLVTEA